MTNFILFIKAAILGIIQGLTEFIPVSSTGHMVIIGKLLDFNGEFAKTFDVFIQLGATLALILYFRHDLYNRCNLLFTYSNVPNANSASKQNFKFLMYLLVAFLPAALVGFLFHKKIDVLLESAVSIGIAQIVGACIILIAERMSAKKADKIRTLNHISFSQALSVGLWQIAALWPGMSRSGCTIMGGLLAKMDRVTATQFSFYLSIPISICSSFFMLIKHHEAFHTFEEIFLLITGFLCAFGIGLCVVHFIMNYVRKHSFVPFAYYRIFLGIGIITLVWCRII